MGDPGTALQVYEILSKEALPVFATRLLPTQKKAVFGEKGASERVARISRRKLALSHYIEIRGELIMTDTVKCRIFVISGDTPEAVTMLVDVGTLGEVAETYLAAKGFYDEIGEVVLETYDAETGMWDTRRVLN